MTRAPSARGQPCVLAKTRAEVLWRGIARVQRYALEGIGGHAQQPLGDLETGQVGLPLIAGPKLAQAPLKRPLRNAEMMRGLPGSARWRAIEVPMECTNDRRTDARGIGDAFEFVD